MTAPTPIPVVRGPRPASRRCWERAVRSGKYDTARAELVKMTWLTEEIGAFKYDYANALALLQLATLAHLAGHKAAAEQIATRVLEMRDDLSVQGNIAGRMERVRMLGLTVLGRNQEALNLLEAQRDTAARELWWVWIERHPAMRRLRREPRVQLAGFYTNLTDAPDMHKLISHRGRPSVALSC